MKKLTPYLSATLFFVFIFMVAAMAQVPTDTATSVINIGPVSIPKAWEPYFIFAGSVYEAVVRLYPTCKNWSIIGFLYKVFQKILPNRNAETPAKPHT